MKQIQIITGKIRIGKTTYLENLILSLKHVVGILQPTDEDHRFFKDIETGEFFRITELSEQHNTFKLGRFIFNYDSFNWARAKLTEAFEWNNDTIVIDEYGPLEFQGEGLEPIVTKIITSSNKTIKIIIVVRDQLLENFLEKFKLKEENVEIIRLEN